MIVDRIPLQWRSCSRFSAILVCFMFGGCLPEEIITPGPPIKREPVLPSLACKPFLKSGYTEKVSYYPGERLRVFLQSRDTADICRLEIFNVSGDSVFATSSEMPLVLDIPEDASEDGFDFPLTASFTLPDLPSGVYLIENKIPFLVKTREHVDVLVVYPSNTANAYADSGGKSLYSLQGRPVAVSFQRPVPLRSLSEYCLRWFSKLEGFSIGFAADVDMDYYERIADAKVIVLAGHSEYWTRQARLNFDRFVDSGGDALILSGNTMWWQVRYSLDEKKMYCYKSADLDPVNDRLLATIEWVDPSLAYPVVASIGADFPRGGYGLKNDGGWNGLKIVTPTSPLFEGLGLSKGDIITLPSLEYDGAPLTGFDENGYPLLDRDALGFHQAELLAFDRGFRGQETTGTFLVFRKTPASGIVVNTATTDWCSPNGMGGASGDVIKKITFNALWRLVNDAPVFSQ